MLGIGSARACLSADSFVYCIEIPYILSSPLASTFFQINLNYRIDELVGYIVHGKLFTGTMEIMFSFDKYNQQLLI